jgi:hypothetical protein
MCCLMQRNIEFHAVCSLIQQQQQQQQQRNTIINKIRSCCGMELFNDHVLFFLDEFRMVHWNFHGNMRGEPCSTKWL